MPAPALPHADTVKAYADHELEAPQGELHNLLMFPTSFAELEAFRRSQACRLGPLSDRGRRL